MPADQLDHTASPNSAPTPPDPAHLPQSAADDPQASPSDGQKVAESGSSQNHFPAQPPPEPDLNRRELSIAQIQALSLLAQGLSDCAVGRRLNINRRTINRWRLYDPLFASRLNRLRKAIWANALDRLRNLLPRSVAILARNLHSDNAAHQLRAAIQLLKIAGASRLAPRVGPDTLYETLLERAQQERAREWDPRLLRTMSPPDQDELNKIHQKLLNHLADCDALPEDCP